MTQRTKAVLKISTPSKPGRNIAIKSQAATIAIPLNKKTTPSLSQQLNNFYDTLKPSPNPY